MTDASDGGGDKLPRGGRVHPGLLHSLSLGSPHMAGYLAMLGSGPSTPLSSGLSPRSAPFYPGEETVESVLGKRFLWRC